ncbi:hypothetical protein [Mycobacterium kubicae]|uniref:hypothetical protein n=1 Tax=Mycobacterium kubicae TaxID=120959 RepID=UPI001041CD88|nr:hypothetical protein [Mycobacterium kubicae]
MTTFMIQLTDGRTIMVEADDIAVTESGALLLIRNDPVLTPVLTLNPRLWLAAHPQDAPAVWSEPADPQSAPRHPPLAI